MTSKLNELNGAIFKVGLLMSIDYRLRDNDYLLCKAFEAIESGQINTKKKNWRKKLIKYVNKLERKPLTPPETISRSRRIIQYNKGLLLGDRAKDRLAAAEKLRNEIKDI